jgi:hypothetical protein
LADAVAALTARRIGQEVSAVAGDLEPPYWQPTESSWAWLAPVGITLRAAGDAATARLDWPVAWDPDRAVACPVAPDRDLASPGRHRGWYIGRALAVGYGVRLQEGLHFIPRQTARGDWTVGIVLAPRLGPEVFGPLDKDLPGNGRTTWWRLSQAVLGELPGRYVPPDLVETMLAGLGLSGLIETYGPEGLSQARAEVEEALRRRRQEVAANPTSEPGRTAASRNRLFGPDEVMAELVCRCVRRLTTSTARNAVIRKQLDDMASKLGSYLPDGTAIEGGHTAGAIALRNLERGKGAIASVITPVGIGTTLARTEESARTCFVGFRGLGRIRGRADLRDLDTGWRGTLCPVQTPESTDTGLVRFTAVGARADAPPNSEWADLSASAALIPFVNHDDPARASIGSKNLKQAVPVNGCEPPLVATGWEKILGLAEGVAAAVADGEVTEVGPDHVVVRTQRGVESRVAFGAPAAARSGIDNSWFVSVKVGDEVRRGQILAHAPEVRLTPESEEAELCLGVNALVALTPWRGLNYEDGIVVSESFGRRMTSTHLVRIDQTKDPGDPVTWLVAAPPGRVGRADQGTPVTRGQVLAQIERADRTQVISPITGELVSAFLDRRRGTVAAIIRVERPLAVGDKLTNRHQGKGVVSAILPDQDMPRLPDGTPIEMILNPVGVLRRLNIGQLWEMHVGLERRLTKQGPISVGRVVADPDGLAASLANLEAPGGRMRLTLADGSPIGGEAGVAVGPQYIIKLNHLASAKLSACGAQPPVAPITGQPSQRRRFHAGHVEGAAQRLGEMEIWALEAAGATAVLADALQTRSVPPQWARGRPRASLRSVQAHLAVAGIDLVANQDGPRPLANLMASEIESLTTQWRQEPEPNLEMSGHPGTAEAETVQWSIPLPEPMRHPWRTKLVEPPPINSVPVLPQAYRVPIGQRIIGLNRHYEELAKALAEHASKSPTAWARARRAVTAIMGEPGKAASDSIWARLAGKRGLLRRHLLGQAVSRSGRSVIVPNPDISPDQVGLPHSLAQTLGIGGLELDDDVVIVNRQPSLHPYNMVALRAILVDGDAIHLHPLPLGGLAGDFDGDTVAVHRPASAAARREAWAKLSPAARLRSSANGAVLAKMDLDIALGLHLATRDGRAPLPNWPDGIGRRPLNAQNLATAVSELVSGAEDEAAALRALAALERAGLQAAVGWSVGAVELLATRRELSATGQPGWLAAAIGDPRAAAALGPLADAAAAGVAGGEKALTQLLWSRGELEGHVTGCYLTGLTSDDYFAAARLALAELAHKKLTTPHAGALTKTLVEIADAVIIAEERCGTPDSVRSPLTCGATDGLCQACYGADPATCAPPALGRRVGVLAATLIGERSTQAAMRTFHHGGGAGTAVGNVLTELRAVFGQGRSTAAFSADGSPLSLMEFLKAQPNLDDAVQVASALEPAVLHAVNQLGSVDRVHVQVVLRQLVDTFRQLDSLREGAPRGQTSLAACAQRVGRSRFEVATARGNLSWLFPGDAERVGGFRTRLAVGDPR